MFIHRPDPIHQVRVETPDPVFAEKLLEQFGGATGELSAALTYFTQSFHTEDQGIRDMLQNIATEEFGHLEMVALMIEQHTKRAKQGAQEKAFGSTLFAMRGYGPHLVDSRGTTGDARYVNEGGNVVRDLRADIAAEAGALATYESLLRQAPDDGSREALRHLATAPVDVLFTDVNLPGGMDGAILARHARELLPHLPVVYASARGDGLDPELRVPGSIFVPKPYVPALVGRILAATLKATAQSVPA